jgi:CRP-like cAMP-binding protein
MKVDDLAKVFSTETLEAGTVLFKQGDLDGDGFIVQQGRVELSRMVGGALQRGLFVEAGEIFGVYKTLFENEMRYFTCTVVQKSRITRIPEQVLKDRIAASDPFIIYCVRNWPNLGDRLINDDSSD